MRFSNTRSKTSVDTKEARNITHLTHIYHVTFAEKQLSDALYIRVCAYTHGRSKKKKANTLENVFDGPAFLANEIYRSICPAFKNQCFSAPAREEDGGVF